MSLPPSPRVTSSLTRQALIRMAVRVALVILITTLISFWHVTSNLETQVRSQLEKYIVERGQRESAIFQLAHDNHALLKAELLRRLAEDGGEASRTRFDELFLQWSDGTLRNAPEGVPSARFDTVRFPTAFVGRDVELDAELRQRLLIFHDLLSSYGPAWHNRFIDTYIMAPENIELIYWPDMAWSLDAPADLYIPGKEIFYLSDPAHNPTREPVWTSLFVDPVANIWMVSLETPVDDPQGRHVATLGHDIVLDELMERIIHDHLDGSYNLLFRADGRLIAHPERMAEIQAANGQFEIRQSGDAHLNRLFQLVTTSSPNDIVLDNRADDEYVAFTRIAGPDWYLVTVYPKSMLTGLAFQTARFILLLGLVSLLIEVGLLYLVLRQQVEQPLRELREATEQVAVGNFDIRLPAMRQDELGRIAHLFRTMASEVAAREADLQQHRAHLEELVEARTRRLETVAALGERLNIELQPAQLLHELVAQIQEKFGYYHAHVYLLDETRERLVLSEGTGRVGEEMKRRGHSIPISAHSLIALAARSAESVRVDDVRHSKDWLPNPLLPETRSEIAVPICVAERVLGVLDVQSERQAGLDEGDATLLRSLASQIGVTLTNARLFEQTAQARERAELANRAKSEFLSNMSHELRTPLNAILGYAQILKRNKELTTLQADGLEVIQQSGEHLLTLINDILDLSKIEAQRLELYPADLPFLTFLHGVAGIIRMRAQQKGLLLHFETPMPLPTGVRADEKRLRQVLLNLLGNAVKFTDEGEVKFVVRLLEEEGLMGNQSEGHASFRFEVTDTGVGIPATQLEKIFLPFEQVGDTQRRGAGTGLGLAISRKLVQAMGGELHVRSVPGYGSTFWFDLELPVLVMEGQPKEKAGRDIIGYKGRPLKILVVDDKDYNRSVMLSLLEPLGFQMVEAENGRQSIEQARAVRPDLIIMDMVMPVMTGFEATREIRSLPELEGITIVGASASVFEADKKQVMLVGCDAFLPKPINARHLFDLLESYLKVEWLYEEELAYPTKGTGSKGDQGNALLPPPRADLAILLDLARRGDMRGIQRQAQRIEQLGSQFAPFAARLNELARRFEEKEILALIQRHIDMEGSA